jgi:alkylhydroperoxidase/carboxymuconolactone decarboxylase family protein YurZ
MVEIDEEALYATIVGHVPAEISKRIKVGMKVDPKLTTMFEDIRLHVMKSDVLDDKTVQLLLFGMMATRLVGPPTRYHAIASKMAGATMEELHAVAGLTLLAGGMRSYNTAGAAIADAFEEEMT